MEMTSVNMKMAEFSTEIFREPMNIHFENISYSSRSTIWKQVTTPILKNISGDFVGGKLTALIGPSGSGKSSLLDIVSGYRTRNLSGQIYVNGQAENLNEMIHQCCYIKQEHSLEPLVTVREAITFVVNVKLPPRIGRQDKSALISKILDDFNLTDAKHVLTKNLSGGQRKRLTLALELISNPSIIFLDESTSGLDSVSAKHCIQILRNLCKKGKIIVCSIHQPSMKILELFDNLYILVEGECIYQGTVGNIIPYLKANNFDCPLYHNPIEYVMELCVLDSQTVYVERLVQSAENGKSQKWFTSPVCWSTIQMNTLNVRTIPIQNKIQRYDRVYATSFAIQFWYLLKRRMVIDSREPLLSYLRIGSHLTCGFVFGWIFNAIGNNGAKMVTNTHFLFCMVLFPLLCSSLNRALTLPQSIRAIQQEYFNGWYSQYTYYLAMIVSDFPVQVLSIVMFVLPSYYLNGQPMEVTRIFRILVAINLSCFFFQDYSIVVGSYMNIQNGVIFSTLTICPYLVNFAGVLLFKEDTTEILRWMYNISMMRHTLEAVTISMFGYDRGPFVCEQDDCSFKHPRDYLSFMSIPENHYTHNIIFILSACVILKFLSCLALKYKLHH